MGFKINEQISGSLFIAGKEFVLDYGNSLKSLHLRVSTLITVPELCISLIDTLNQMPNYGLQDGAQIILQLNGQLNLTRKFRVYRWTRSPAPLGFQFTIECYIDSPRYWLGTSNAAITGSSAQVLQQITETCGLTWDPNNANSSDSMLWLPGNQTFGNFARQIARAGYISDTSHMVLCVDSMGKMRYRDINANPAPKVTVGYTVPSSGNSSFQQIIDFTPITKSGTTNAVGGYLHARYVQPIEGQGSTIDQLEDELSFTPDAQYPLLSSDVRSKMVRGSVSFSAIDFGNVHPNYERARYQNTRYDLLNSLIGEVLFPFQTAWEPCDNFNLALPADLSSSQYDGEYTIQTKVIFIQGVTYNEKIVAVKNGLNK
jgi:hypothetical protein